jgi:predicted RNase H-like HicB family nuclease
MIPPYHINVFWSEQDACWIADAPDLEFCSAHGNTPVEAVAEIQIALEAWLDVARQEGKPIPQPCYRPATTAAQ